VSQSALEALLTEMALHYARPDAPLPARSTLESIGFQVGLQLVERRVCAARRQATPAGAHLLTPPAGMACSPPRGASRAGHTHRYSRDKPRFSEHLDAVARCRRCKNTGARIQERRDVLRGVEWSALTGAQLQSKCRHLLCGVELCNLLGLHRGTGCGNKLHAKSAQHLAGR
jgi:hypothetical protein